MADYDLIVRNAKIVTEDRQTEGDIGVKDGRIAAIEPGLKGTATREIDAGRQVRPAGRHRQPCHIEQKSGFGVMCADDFYSGTVSAAFGGTTTVIPFAAQHRGMSLRQVVQGLSRGGDAQGGDRLRLSPDRHRSLRRRRWARTCRR